MKITVRCDGVENGADAEVVHLSAKDRQPDDPAESASVKATIELQLTDWAERGKFEAGKSYHLEFAEAPEVADGAPVQAETPA